MRKLVGAFLGILSVAFLALAYSQLAHARFGYLPYMNGQVAKPECRNELAKRIVELVDADAASGKNGTTILQLQYELTLLKLAAAATDNQTKTVEALVRKETQEIQDQLAKLQESDKKAVMDKLLALYEPEKAEDEAVAAQKVDELLKKFPTGQYGKLEARFRNKEVSAFVIAHRMLKKDKSAFNEQDSAILWLQSEISDGLEAEHGRGSAEANLAEVSSHLIRLTGIIGPARSLEDIQARIDQAETAMAAEFRRIEEIYKEDLKKSCAGCATCTAEQPVSPAERVEALAAAMSQVQGKMKDPAYRSKVKVGAVFDEARRRGVDADLEVEDETEQKEEATPKQETTQKKEGDENPYLLTPDEQKTVDETTKKDTVVVQPTQVKDTVVIQPTQARDTVKTPPQNTVIDQKALQDKINTLQATQPTDATTVKQQLPLPEVKK